MYLDCLEASTVFHLTVQLFISSELMQEQQMCRAERNVIFEQWTLDAPTDEIQSKILAPALHQHLDTKAKQLRVFAAPNVRQR